LSGSLSQNVAVTKPNPVKICSNHIQEPINMAQRWVEVKMQAPVSGDMILVNLLGWNSLPWFLLSSQLNLATYQKDGRPKIQN
jgi:hypothetical protein